MSVCRSQKIFFPVIRRIAKLNAILKYFFEIACISGLRYGLFPLSWFYECYLLAAIPCLSYKRIFSNCICESSMKQNRRVDLNDKMGSSSKQSKIVLRDWVIPWKQLGYKTFGPRICSETSRLGSGSVKRSTINKPFCWNIFSLCNFRHLKTP